LIRLYYRDKITKDIYLPITEAHGAGELRESIIDEQLKYFKVNESVAPTKEQQDEQRYIMNYISDNNIHSGIINMKTGRGKTHIIFWLIEKRKVPTLILCHNIKQAHETYEKLINYTNINAESDLSLITSKSKETVPKAITITTHTGFVRNFKELYKDKFKQIIYDECDYNLSFPARQEFDWCMSSSLIMSWTALLRWLTWTPYRNWIWDEPLVKLIGQVISMPHQTNNWYNILPHIVQCQYYNKRSYEWNSRSELRQQMFEDDYRIHSQLMTIRNNLWKYNLILLEQINEVEQFHYSFDSINEVPTVKLHWQLTIRELREQQAKLAALREKRESFIIVWTIDMIGRWVDIPEIDTVFLFAPVKFEWTVVQAIGRALRSTPDKTEVKVYDRQDLPLLTKQAKAREKSYKIEYGPLVNIKKIYIKCDLTIENEEIEKENIYTAT
jgi:superfamily II DNA or RNA helicase